MHDKKPLLVQSDAMVDAAYILGASMLMCAAMLAAGMYYAAREIPANVTHTHVSAPAASVTVSSPPATVLNEVSVAASEPKVLMLQVTPEFAADVGAEQLAEPILPVRAHETTAAPSEDIVREAIDRSQWGARIPRPKGK